MLSYYIVVESSTVCTDDGRKDQTIRSMHISSNTTIYEVVCYLLYVKHNYFSSKLGVWRAAGNGTL
jgi:hypothetical protein